MEPRRHGGGKPRLTCSPACKQYAYKAGRRFAWPRDAARAEPVRSIMPEHVRRDPATHVVEVLIAVDRIVSELEHLAGQVPPALRWRCLTLADAIAAARTEVWGADRG